MGNAASSQSPSPSPHRSRSQSHPYPHPTPRPDAPSPAPRPPPVHRSLRTKKKSLELPDLASLTLTPAHSPNASPHGPYRRPKASSPIPIPTSPQNPLSKEHSYHSFGPQRPPHLQSATQISLNVAVPDVVGPATVTQPSTHIPIYPPNQRPRTGNPYYSSHSRPDLRYNSTRSFSSRNQPAPVEEEHHDPDEPFRTETIHSTIPIGISLTKAEAARQSRKAQGDDVREPILTKITWHGGGKSVYLARAGDANWKGRTPMDRDSTSNSFTTWVPLLPGTHHLKFVVDDQWRVADDLPTAVDDDGSLANYVNVSMSGFTPPSPTQDPVSSATPTPAMPLSPGHADKAPGGHQISFWSDSSTQGATSNEPAQWTTVLPVELLAAAQAEEAYLALTAGRDDGSIPAPNIPPAPILPRHLDKLILNVRPGPTPASREGARERERETGRRSSEREKDRERERNGANQNGRVRSRTRHASAGLGMTTAAVPDIVEGQVAEDSGVEGGKEKEGKEVTGKPLAQLSGPALADDASVLPVPSHVVLHHLSTSAIRNGVLAVGNTTRYKKKSCDGTGAGTVQTTPTI
ncbi:hypothetical protein DENSPDRAFT_849080 [Dentipellis sp. KUC8613]|nr:hypothetical protein DENSPDRAFT_849080 [Dentipellis sp. KUC8613]